MKSWPTKPLLQLCRPKQWTTLSKNKLSQSGYPVYGANGKIGFADNYTHEQPTILIGCRGSCGTIHVTEPKSYANGNAMALDNLDTSQVLLPWAVYFFHHRGFADTITGSSQPQITQQGLARVEVPLPPLAEQKRIVKLLDEADELRKLRVQADHRANNLIPAIFHEMFGDPIANSKKFPTATLGELASVERGKFTPRPRNDHSYFDGKYPFIQTGDIANSNGLVTQYSQTLNEKGKAVSKEFPAGAIVIAIVGATIGRTAILGIPVFATDSVIAIQPHRDQVVTEYVHYVLQFWRPVFIAQAPETARANLNAATLKAVKIPVPPLSQQKEFAQRVKEIRELEASQATSRTRLDALFQSMLHRAFNGEL